MDERELVAGWLLEAEREVQRAQRALELRRPYAAQRLASARRELELAQASAGLLLSFPMPLGVRGGRCRCCQPWQPWA
jgi:hypothetical protein